MDGFLDGQFQKKFLTDCQKKVLYGLFLPLFWAIFCNVLHFFLVAIFGQNTDFSLVDRFFPRRTISCEDS